MRTAPALPPPTPSHSGLAPAALQMLSQPATTKTGQNRKHRSKSHTYKPLVRRSSGRNKVFALWWSHQTSLRPSRSVRLDWGDTPFVAGLDSMFKTC